MNNFTLFLTGLSGSGKTTIADKILEIYNDLVLIDGDILRMGLCEDLAFSINDRKENMRRLKHLCKMFNDNDRNIITTFITPLEEERIKIKSHIKNCYIIHIKCDLETCEKRDVKGLYKKARLGIIKDFTGISSPYEEPIKPDLIIDTQKNNLDYCVKEMIEFIKDRI